MNQAHAAATRSGPANRSGRRHQAPRPASAVDPPMRVTARITCLGSTTSSSMSPVGSSGLRSNAWTANNPTRTVAGQAAIRSHFGPRGRAASATGTGPALAGGPGGRPSTPGSDVAAVGAVAGWLDVVRPAPCSSLSIAAAERSAFGRKPRTGASARRSPKSVALRLEVRITAGGRGSAAISSATSIPSRPGRTTSSTTTSAGSSRSRSSAWAPLVASPTTSSPSASSSWRA